MVNTTLLILLVIVNYSNFYLTHMHGKRKRPITRVRRSSSEQSL